MVDETSLSTIGILTNDRLDVLQRCIASCAENLDRHGRSSEIVIVDDTLTNSNKVRIPELIREVNRNLIGRVYYAGPEEKHVFSAELIRYGIPEDVCNHLLGTSMRSGSGPGTNRNALLLECAGEQFLSCDDDSICTSVDSREGEQSIDVCPVWNPFEHMIFTNGSSDNSAIEPAPTVDMIAAHQQLLGCSLRTMMSLPPQYGKGVHSGLRSRLVADLLDARGRVLVTMSGVLGDPGVTDLFDVMILTGDARTRFLDAWRAFGSEAMLNSHFAVARPTIAGHGSPLFTTTTTGFDNRALLPPFLPQGRGEDTFFGQLLSKSRPDSYLGYIPILMEHRPPNRRQFISPWVPTLSTVMSILIHGCPDPIDLEPSKRLKAIGRHLVDCGAASVSDFVMHLRYVLRRWLVAAIERVERLLEFYRHKPSQWAVELNKWIMDFQRRVAQDDFLDQISVRNREGLNDTAAGLIQHFARDYGEALQYWPDMIMLAKSLGVSGHRLARLVT